MKKLTILVVLLIASIQLNAQTKRTEIYFLADTINATPNNRMMEIGTEGGMMYYYNFFCRCIPPYEFYPTFVFRIDQVKSKTFDKSPEGKYVSMAALLDLFAKHGNDFENKYELHIVELLPNKKFKMAESLSWVPNRKITTVN